MNDFTAHVHEAGHGLMAYLLAVWTRFNETLQPGLSEKQQIERMKSLDGP